MTIDKDNLKGINNLVSHFEERKDRARKRLEEISERTWNFAFLGIRTTVNEFSFDGIGLFRSVIEPPGEVELARTLKQKQLFSAVGRYSHSITHELSINVDTSTDQQRSFSLAWWIVAALRVKTVADLLVPVAADYSWSTIAGLDDGACNVQLIEDIPLAKFLGDPITITESDFEWVSQNLIQFIELLEKPKFRLAVDSLTTHHHLSNERMMVSSLWAGIESIIGVEHELRFRIAAYLSAYLHKRGNERLESNKLIKKLYDFRSKAVHGSSLDKEELDNHVIEVRKLLSILLISIIENNEVPDQNDFDKLLFT